MSSAFFYLDENGRKSDAALHEDILAEGDHAAAFAGSTYPWLKRAGWTDAEIRTGSPALHDEMIRAAFPATRSVVPTVFPKPPFSVIIGPRKMPSACDEQPGSTPRGRVQSSYRVLRLT